MKLKKSVLACILTVFAIAAGVMICMRADWGKTEENPDKKYVEDFVENIGDSGADSVLLSMFPVETYNEETLYTHILAVTKILDVTLDSGEQLVEVLETILERPNTLTKVFLGIHTESVREEGTAELGLSYKSDLLREGYSWEEAILELAKLYPNIMFEIVCYYPKISSLAAMEQEEVEALVDWQAYVAELYYHYDVVPNILFSMPGSEEWLICNESNYQDTFNLTPEIANEVEVLQFCDRAHIVYWGNLEEKCNRLLELVEAYRENPPVYGEQEAYTYVFLGDSVIGNYDGSLSIPGVVSFMTGARVINCGFGGLSATKATDTSVGVQDVVDTLLAKDPGRDVTVISNQVTQKGILEFWEADLPENTDKLVFFLSFGINDYMTGHPVYNEAMDEACYKGALAEAAESLKAVYPNAQIVLMTPNYIALGNYGEDINGEKGSQYADYVEAVYELGAEKNLQVIDVYREAGITSENSEEYLADMCHPNYLGRFKIGKVIWRNMALQR